MNIKVKLVREREGGTEVLVKVAQVTEMKIRPLKVEIYCSTVSTDGFHTKSIIEQQS